VQKKKIWEAVQPDLKTDADRWGKRKGRESVRSASPARGTHTAAYANMHTCADARSHTLCPASFIKIAHPRCIVVRVLFAMLMYTCIQQTCCSRLHARRVANYKGEVMLTSAGPVTAPTLVGANIS
jgi:hypothetical protein